MCYNMEKRKENTIEMQAKLSQMTKNYEKLFDEYSIMKANDANHKNSAGAILYAKVYKLKEEITDLEERLRKLERDSIFTRENV